MLKIIDSKDIITDAEARDLYPDCKIVMTDFDYDKLSGRVYAISTSPDTADDLAKVRFALVDEGKHTALLGHYKGCCLLGVFYEVKEGPI